MALRGTDNTVLMEVEKIERKGNNLLIKGKVFGAMPMSAQLSPQEARNGLKLLNWRTLLFLLTLIFRKG
ncbi:MAG: hypothetical protein PVG24_10695 [Gammaproteobacteria bacterium]